MGNAQTRNCQVASVSGPLHVQGRLEAKGRRWVQQGAWYCNGCSSGLCHVPAFLFLIIVLEAPSKDFHTWELLYADDV